MRSNLNIFLSKTPQEEEAAVVGVLLREKGGGH